MIGKKIPVVFRIMFVIWVILQVCLVIKYWDMPNHDDAQAYVKLASECIARGTWYPDVHNQYEDFYFRSGVCKPFDRDLSSLRIFLLCPIAEFIDEYCNGI